MVNFDVDFVVPFVDNHDPIWRETFRQFCINHFYPNRLSTIDQERFDNQGLFSYLIKGVYKFMPWIRTIHIIVSNPEQMPQDIDMSKVHMVLHKEIIPEKFLPTFNSTTIEMFLDRIPNLAEHFIYANDDMYPIKPLAKEDFFTADGKIKSELIEKTLVSFGNSYNVVCFNNYKHIIEYFNIIDKKGRYLKPHHGYNPMITSHCKDCFLALKKKIIPNITAFRTNQQHNQYIYPLWEHFIGNEAPMEYKFQYVSYKRPIEEIYDIIVKNPEGVQVLCINDTEHYDHKTTNYNRVKEAFEEILK